MHIFKLYIQFPLCYFESIFLLFLTLSLCYIKLFGDGYTLSCDSETVSYNYACSGNNILIYSSNSKVNASKWLEVIKKLLCGRSDDIYSSPKGSIWSIFLFCQHLFLCKFCPYTVLLHQRYNCCFFVISNI